MSYYGDPRDTSLLERVESLVDLDMRLELMLRTHRRRQVRDAVAGVVAVLLFVVGIILVARSDHEVEPVDPDAPVETHLVIPDEFAVEESGTCRGTGSYAGAEEGAPIELLELGAPRAEMATPAQLPAGNLVQAGDELSLVLRDGESRACVFDLGDLGLSIDEIERFTVFPFIPPVLSVKAENGVNHAVFYLEGSTTAAPFFSDSGPSAAQFINEAQQQGPGLGGAVALNDSGDATFSFGPECERVVVRVDFGVGELTDILLDEFPEYDSVGAEYQRFHECELVEHREGYVEHHTEGTRLGTRHAGPVEIIAFDPDQPGAEPVSIEVEVTWTATGHPTREVNHGDKDGSWLWVVDASAVGTIAVDGVDLGAPDSVSDVRMSYGLGMYTEGNLYDELAQTTISDGCSQINDPSLDGPMVSGYPDRDHSFKGFFIGSEEILVTAVPIGEPVFGRVVLDVTELGEEGVPLPGVVSQIFPHIGGFSVAWDALDEEGKSILVDWTMECVER
ncbi:MAG: hypothetical protein WB245_03215 [Acidimicrobiia bacterium]